MLACKICLGFIRRIKSRYYVVIWYKTKVADIAYYWIKHILDSYVDIVSSKSTYMSSSFSLVYASIFFIPWICITITPFDSYDHLYCTVLVHCHLCPYDRSIPYYCVIIWSLSYYLELVFPQKTLAKLFYHRTDRSFPPGIKTFPFLTKWLW